jgi:hypothetical protein
MSVEEIVSAVVTELEMDSVMGMVLQLVKAKDLDLDLESAMDCWTDSAKVSD